MSSPDELLRRGVEGVVPGLSAAAPEKNHEDSRLRLKSTPASPPVRLAYVGASRWTTIDVLFELADETCVGAVEPTRVVSDDLLLGPALLSTGTEAVLHSETC